MEWIAMKSRMISEIGYDEERQILYVRLRSRELKKYYNISPSTFENLRTAESPGFYFSYYIARRGRSKLAAGRRSIAFKPMHLAKVATLTFVFFASSVIAR